MIDTHDDPEAAVALIRQIHAEGGRRVSDSEVVEFLSRPVFLGHPEPWDKRGMEIGDDGILRPHLRRGPKSAKSQYDEFRRRWKGLFHKLVRLHQHRKLQRNDGEYVQDLVFAIATSLKEGKRKISGDRVHKEWARTRKDAPPSRSTICRHLKKFKK